MIVKVVVPDSIYARVYFARGEQGAQGPTGNTGPQGPSGIVNVDSPITNSGTSTAANIGINQALLQLAPAQVTGTAVITTDPRLSDQRVPTDGSVTDTKIVAGGLSPNRVAGTAVITTDSRLSDARTPLAHAASHGSTGSDPVTLAQSQVTNLVSDLAGKASTTHASTHGSAGSDPVTIAQSQVTGLTSALAAKAPLDSPVFTTKVTIPFSSTFLQSTGTGELRAVASAPGLGYIPYTASVTTGIAWQALSELVRTNVANIITSPADASVPLQLRRFSATATANIQEWDDQTGAVLSAIGPSGAFSAPQASITGTVVGNVPFTVTGASGQTANLFSVRSNTAELAFISSGGNLNVFNQVRVGTSTSLGQLTTISGAAGTVGAVVRGAASQSANLQEWQNSAGSILSRVSSSGNIVSTGFNTTNDYSVIGEVNSGGTIRLLKATAAGAPPSNYVRLQVLAGTNTNTLKLVAVGPNGTPVTILDNLA